MIEPTEFRVYDPSDWIDNPGVKHETIISLITAEFSRPYIKDDPELDKYYSDELGSVLGG